ncbi:MAG: UvrD-helicase domain-containing protein, partial [Planctomycetes bacterium]|nr:UvrD-helicase domain-containing protein [Planctomycetota bacterium]
MNLSPVSADTTAPLTFDPQIHPENMRGVHAIEASAGTGKTYSIAVLWLRLLIEDSIPVEHVLVSTFTNAATAELKERLLEILHRARTLAADADETQGTASLPDPQDSPEAFIIHKYLSQANNVGSELYRRLTTAVSMFDLAPIKTLHGFCNSLIRRHVLEIGADPESEPVEHCNDIISDIAGDYICRALAEGSDVLLDDLNPLDAINGFSRSIAKEIALGREHMFPQADQESPELWQQQRDQAIADLQTCSDQGPGNIDAAETLNDKLIACGIKKGASLKSVLTRIESVLAGNTGIGELTGAGKDRISEQWPSLFEQFNNSRLVLDALQDDESLMRRIQARGHLLDYFIPAFQQKKLQKNILTYDDILIIIRDALKKYDDGGPLAAAVRERYRAVIIDESQ